MRAFASPLTVAVLFLSATCALALDNDNLSYNGMMPTSAFATAKAAQGLFWSYMRKRKPGRSPAQQASQVMFTCTIDSGGVILPCIHVIFNVVDSQDHELAKIRTNAEGKCSFTVGSESYKIIPASKHYQIESGGNSRCKSGDHVEMRLKAI